jgi:predicted ATPase
MRFAQGSGVQPQSRERLLILGTARSEEVGAEHPLWNLVRELRNSEQLTEIEIGPFDEAESNELARRLAGHELNPEQMAQLYRDTEGNPLFIVESLRSRGEGSRAMAGEWLPPAQAGAQALPPKIYAVIHSRIAQLSPPARAIATLAATIGRAFSFALLASASGAGEKELMQGLDELWQRRILREHGTNEYDFSHDRIRDVAYAESTPLRRHMLHRQVAQALEVIHSAEVGAVSGEIATHFAQAGLPEPALSYFEKAAIVEQRIFAHAEAVTYLNKALALLAELPLTAERLRQELRLRSDLGISLGTLIGFSDSAVKENYERAQALAIQVGNDEQHLMVLSGLFSYYIWRGEVAVAQKLAEQSITLAEQMSDSTWLAEAEGRLGVVFYFQGRWQASRLYSEKAANIKEHQLHSRPRLGAAAQHSWVLHRRFLAIELWYLGYPDQSMTQMQRALADAQELAHPYTLASALASVANLYYIRREPQGVSAYAEKAMAYAQQQGFPSVLSGCRMQLGWVLVQQGHVEEGIARIREAVDATVARVHALHLPSDFAVLAQAYGSAKQPDKGIPLVDQALEHVEATGHYAFQAELHQIKGELLQMSGASLAEVEAHFREALAVARQQEAKSIELRVAISLSRLWRDQGRLVEARVLLASIYEWFTEGFDTPDLQEANSLLHALM